MGALLIEDGDLKVRPIKRNAKTAQMNTAPEPRLVLALELAGRDDGATALELYASGEVKLPRAVRTQIEKLAERKGNGYKPIGDAVRQLLDRNEFWQVLKQSNPDISPYSLRHGWAYRAHKGYSRSFQSAMPPSCLAIPRRFITVRMALGSMKTDSKMRSAG